jgi:hypothetical protein
MRPKTQLKLLTLPGELLISVHSIRMCSKSLFPGMEEVLAGKYTFVQSLS